MLRHLSHEMGATLCGIIGELKVPEEAAANHIRPVMVILEHGGGYEVGKSFLLVRSNTLTLFSWEHLASDRMYGKSARMLLCHKLHSLEDAGVGDPEQQIGIITEA